MSNLSNSAAILADFSQEVCDFERADRGADVILADVGTRVSATLAKLDIKDRAAALAAMAGKYKGTPEGVLYPALKAGLIAAYVHPDDWTAYDDKNVTGEAVLRGFNFKTKKFVKMTKGDIAKAIGSRGTKVRNQIVARAFAKEGSPDPLPEAVKRCFDIGEMSRKIGDLPAPTRGERKEDLIKSYGGDEAIHRIVHALDDVVAMFPKNVQVAARAKQKG